MIEARIVCDSIGEYSPRLTTFVCKYPKFIHGEFMTHRAFSRNASSSRAIPVSKNLAEVRNDELRASPMYWGAEQKGMASGEELDDEKKHHSIVLGDFSDRDVAKDMWRVAAREAARIAEQLVEQGVHKSIVNRILEPFLHINVVMTSAEPGLLNFFGLRLDRAAQPEIRILAEAMWKEWNYTKPMFIRAGEWHLPFIDDSTADLITEHAETKNIADLHCLSIKVSVARCARVSYLSFDTGKRSTIEEDLKLYERLIVSKPIHASPAEHQATPTIWEHQMGGNFGPFWRQYRKLLDGEFCAPLPEEYQSTPE